MKIIFLGGSGSGKSTVGKRLATDLKWDWISVGEILRQSTEPWVQQRLETAELFSDEMIAELVLPRFKEAKNAALDGFPRTLRQAEMIAEQEGLVDLVVEMEVPEEEAVRRILARGRTQDTREVARERWESYNASQAEIMACLVGSGIKILKIDGVGTQDEVYKRAVNEILTAMKENQ